VALGIGLFLAATKSRSDDACGPWSMCSKLDFVRVGRIRHVPWLLSKSGLPKIRREMDSDETR
jgi:hypothetical protein